MSTDDVSRLVVTLFRHSIREPDAEAGLDRLVVLLGGSTTREEARLAVAQALAAGYVHDPVRLPAGALQCHWHVELTPSGVEEARRLRPGIGDIQ
jgi:hypothetical protein